MKKILVVLSGVLFITLLTLSVNAQDPKKKDCKTKAKTEKCATTVKCSTEKSKDCPKACDKKADVKKCDDKKEETKKKEEKK